VNIQNRQFLQRSVAASVVACVLFVEAIPAEASENYRFNHGYANAYFDSTDSSACIETSVNVQAYDNVDKSKGSKGPPKTSSRTDVYFFQYDSCNDGYVFYFCSSSNRLEDDGLRILGPKLNAATLNTVLDCTDENGDVVFNLSLALTWIAVGELERTKLNDRYRTPDFASINHFSGSSRSAGASGSVSDGNTPTGRFSMWTIGRRWNCSMRPCCD
jgi:hypothetical protein